MQTRQVLSCSVAISIITLLTATAARADALDDFLASCESRYDPSCHMLAGGVSGTGYHTTLKPGTRTHPTRQSLDYAVALVAHGGEKNIERGGAIFRKVISLQDTDPANRTYGIWSWYLEEPLTQMSPPDWNWADFCGARIAQTLHDHSGRLSPELAGEMKASLGHAARAIRKRNVGPGYTNIAIMGGGVTAAAGEILGDEDLLRYGRERLQRVVKHTRYHGHFNEYNSPTYTLVVLHECERALHLVRDPASRTAAEELLRVAWQDIAASFHPATQQWAGPHSRAYRDRISASTVGYLAARTGVPLHTGSSRDVPTESYLPFASVPCPEDLAPRFRALPEEPLELRRTFFRREPESASTVGTTWLDGAACLGSVNRSCLWTQRRPLIAYWQTEADPAIVLRVRFLHDGKDFSSVGICSEQRGSRVLSVFYTSARNGDWHIHLDRPKDGVFHAEDFRLRYELQGKGVTARPLASGRYELAAGGHRAVIHTLPGEFYGQAVHWELGRDGDRVFLDAVCYAGERRAFDFRKSGVIELAAGLELLTEDATASASSPELSAPSPGTARANWNVTGGLTVQTKTHVP